MGMPVKLGYATARMEFRSGCSGCLARNPQYGLLKCGIACCSVSGASGMGGTGGKTAVVLVVVLGVKCEGGAGLVVGGRLGGCAVGLR